MDSKRELLRSAEVAIAGLKNPHALTACFGCLMAIGFRLVDDTSSMKFLTMHCHEYFVTVMAFVAQDWTEARRAAASRALLRAYVGCPKCSPPGQRGHGAVTGLEFPLACVSAVAAVAAALTRWLGQLDKGNPFANRHRSWPASADELFPAGPAQTLTGLLVLMDGGVEVQGLVTSILAVHRPLVLPALSTEDNRQRLITSFISLMNAADAKIASDVAKLRAPVLPAVRDRIAQRHLKPLYTHVQLLLWVFAHPDFKEDDGPQFIRGREAELFAALSAAIAHLTDPLGTHNELTRLATMVWNCVPPARPRSLGAPDTPWYVRRLEEDVLHSLNDPYLALHASLFEQTARRGCHARDCRRPVHERAAAGGFQRCGTCRVVSYCSRECQRKDWAHTSYPHKAVCDSLRDLFAFVRMGMRADEFAAACRAHGFALERVDALIEWAANRDPKDMEDVVSDFAHGNGFGCVGSSGRIYPLPSTMPAT